MLKAFGFPEPVFERGQFYFRGSILNPQIGIIGEHLHALKGVIVFRYLDKTGYEWVDDGEMTFLPTAAYIQQLLPGADIFFHEGEYICTQRFDGYSAGNNYNVISWQVRHKSMHDCAALGWLEQQKKLHG